jgi:hypothetical protein
MDRKLESCLPWEGRKARKDLHVQQELDVAPFLPHEQGDL